MNNQTRISNWIRKTVMVLALVVMGVYCQAQSWYDMTRWLGTEYGAKQLASLAHPMDTYMRHSVALTTSDYVIIEIKFEGIFRNYWCKYKLYKGVYDGRVLFKDIKTLSEGTWPESFIAIEKLTDISTAIDDANGSFFDKALRYFHDCSWYSALGEYRAAMMLSKDFYDSEY